jgi:hypothetical protein
MSAAQSIVPTSAKAVLIERSSEPTSACSLARWTSTGTVHSIVEPLRLLAFRQHHQRAAWGSPMQGLPTDVGMLTTAPEALDRSRPTGVPLDVGGVDSPDWSTARLGRRAPRPKFTLALPPWHATWRSRARRTRSVSPATSQRLSLASRPRWCHEAPGGGTCQAG